MAELKYTIDLKSIAHCEFTSSNFVRATKLNKMATERIIEAMDFESDTSNWKFDFKKMSKQHGREFIEIITAMWEANDGVQTEEEFCKMNSNMPEGFFKNVIKNKKTNTR